MLAGTFTQPDMFNIAVPEATIDKDSNKEAITILMNANNEFAIETTPYSSDELNSLIKNTLDKNKPMNKEVSVQLKADKDVKSRDLISAMEMLSTTGLQSISLLTVTSDSSPTPHKKP